jgi:hypothetical protein
MYVPLSTMNNRISKIERLQSNKPQLRTKKLLTSAPKTTQATNHQLQKTQLQQKSKQSCTECQHTPAGEDAKKKHARLTGRVLDFPSLHCPPVFGLSRAQLRQNPLEMSWLGRPRKSRNRPLLGVKTGVPQSLFKMVAVREGDRPARGPRDCFFFSLA